MELRHLRCFIAVAEELHFARAAERLHIEQSPLSRAIKQLEDDLNVRLFDRDTQGTRLTWPGQVFLEEARRVLATVEQARASAKAAATGYRGMLRIALSDGIVQPRLSALLALCREEEPEVDIRLFEVPLGQQLKGLRDDLYDAGFAKSEVPGEGFIATPAWSDPLVIAVPARHPLLAHRELPLEDVLRYPLVLCAPDACEGCCQQIAKVLGTSERKPVVAEQVMTHELMMTLVAAGYGVGFATESQIAVFRHPEIVARPLAGHTPVLTTYLLRKDVEPSAQLERFIDRVNAVDE
ncbi:LysR family transcriptional regulator [Xanthomonas arboricola pv. juglandis]|uniref:LysR family transcriptional regulator n=1 Tax=Xanthomonas arboricola TaxID=56448 RepID=UPI002018F08D|nr:LysR family transcriptional regulator [Xanthomonas arboricola]UQP97332.1 LysR family transcriptional regulator [Xanthomonas arboricola pv. juglandis]UQQ01549.1 LysR family transcriptional regulator [Xanthomonas arboricola pv. juglandis]